MKSTRSVDAAPHFAMAQQRIIEGDPAGALASAKRVGSILGMEIPSVWLPRRLNIITLQAAYWLMLGELAIECARVLENQIRSADADAMDDDEKYTADYLYGFFEFCAGRFSLYQEEFLKIANLIAPFAQGYDYSNVSPSLVYEMPLGARTEGGLAS